MLAAAIVILAKSSWRHRRAGAEQKNFNLTLDLNTPVRCASVRAPATVGARGSSGRTVSHRRAACRPPNVHWVPPPKLAAAGRPVRGPVEA